MASLTPQRSRAGTGPPAPLPEAPGDDAGPTPVTRHHLLLQGRLAGSPGCIRPPSVRRCLESPGIAAAGLDFQQRGEQVPDRPARCWRIPALSPLITSGPGQAPEVTNQGDSWDRQRNTGVPWMLAPDEGGGGAGRGW